MLNQRHLKHGLVICTLLLLPSFALALPAPNVTVMMENIGILARITQAIAIIMGLGLVIGGILKLKHYGEMRSMMSHNASVASSLAMLFGGVVLLMIPTMLSTALLAFWGTTNPLPFPTTGDPNVDAIMNTIIMFVRFLGVVSFIRGVLLLSKLGREGGQQHGGLGKGLIFIGAGVLCIHIVGAAQLIESILGFTGATS